MNIENLTNLPKDNFIIGIENKQSNSKLIGEIFHKYYPNVFFRDYTFTGSSLLGYAIVNGRVEYLNKYTVDNKYPNLIHYKNPQEFIEKHSQSTVVTNYNIF